MSKKVHFKKAVKKDAIICILLDKVKFRKGVTKQHSNMIPTTRDEQKIRGLS